MIKIYRKSSGDVSSRKAKIWMQEHSIPYEMYSMDDLSLAELKHILRLSNGVEEIMLSTKRAWKTYQELVEPFCGWEVTFNEMVHYLLRNTELLRQPLIFDEQRLLVGYNEEEIRKFLPRLTRKMAYRNAAQELL